DHCLRLDGLLVKVGAHAAAAIKSVGANGAKVTLFGDLQFRQPAQGLQASLKHRLLSGCPSAQNQGVWELRVVISQLLFKPAPVRLGGPFEKFHEPGSECLTGLVDQAVPAQPAQVFMNADKANAPRPRPAPRALALDNPLTLVRRASGGRNSGGCGSGSLWDRTRDARTPRRLWPASARALALPPIH